MSSMSAKNLRQYRSQSNLQSPAHGPNKFQVEFSEEPYITNNNFAVFTPTVDSIEKLYKSTNIQPQRFIKPQTPQRTLENPELYEEELAYRPHSQTPKLNGSRGSQRSLKIQNNQTIEQFAQQIQQSGRPPLTHNNLERLQSKDGMRPPMTPQLLHKLKSYKTNSTVGILQGLPLNKPDIQQYNTISHENVQGQNTMNSMKKTVSYPGLPWVQLDVTKRYADPFGKRQTVRTQGAFRATGKESVNEMITMSKTISTNLGTLLRQQRDREFLASQRMIPVPRIVTYPAVQKQMGGKRFLIAENDAHQRETNTGYSRKANGTFYNH